MHEPIDHRSTGDELEWLAFCFVSGDMEDDQRTAFESRLAEDQVAREAVARAVELVQAVAVAETHVSDRPMPARTGNRRTSWPRRLAWMSLGASAALVLAVAWLQSGTIASWFASPSPDHHALAEVWSQTQETVRDIVQTEPYETQPLLETDVSPDESLPSWITAAIFNSTTGDLPDDVPSTHDES